MKRAALSLVVLAALSVPSTAAEDAAPCQRPERSTLVASAKARVFAVPRDGYRDVYACLYARDRPWRIGQRVPGSIAEHVRPIRLAGRYVAYVNYQTTQVSRTSRLFVRDLRTGEVRHSWVGAPEGDMDFYDEFDVTDLEVERFGAVAWIVRTQYREPGFPPNYGPIEYAVYKSDETGDAVRLDRDETVDANSLALSGSILYWTKDGQPQSAALD